MKKSNKARRRVSVVFGILLSGLVALTPAVAQAASCSSGYACGWKDTNYGGGYYGTAQNVSLWPSNARNWISSAYANGAACRQTQYYRSWNYWTGNVYGDHFTLNSKQLVGQIFQDANLHNGAGIDGGSTDWGDDIEATAFVKC